MVSINPDDEHPFGDLTPEAFIRATSAVETRTHSKTMTSHGLNRGRAGFELFVSVRLSGCRVRLEANSEFPARATLSSYREEREFVGEEDEYPDDFARRLRREAQSMGAVWSFVATVAPFRVRPADADVPAINPDDHEAVEAAIARGEMQRGLCWSASHQDSNERQYLGGVIYLDSNGFPEREATGTVDPTTDPYCNVLLEDPCS